MKMPKIRIHVFLVRFFNNPKTIEGFGVFETWVKFISRALIFVVIICAFIVIYKDYHADYYLIRTFSVPESMDKKGFGGAAFVSAVLVELTKVRKNLYNDSNKGNLRSLSNTRFLNDKNRIAMEEDIGLKNGTKIGDYDLKTITHFIKRLLDNDNDKSITGVVTLNAQNKYFLNMKLSPDDKVISVEDSTAEGLVKQAAFELMMGDRRDYRLDNAINYYSSQSDFDKAEQLSEVAEMDYRTSFNGKKDITPSDWIGLYLAQSNLYIAKRDLIKAEIAVDSLCLKFSNDMSGLCQRMLISNTKMLNYYYSNLQNTDSINFYSKKTIDLCSRYEKDSAKWQSRYSAKKYANALVYFFWSQALSVSIDLTVNQRNPVFEKLNEALRFDPNLSLANNDLAYYYMIDVKPAKYQIAESYIKKALQSAPNHAVFLDTYAEFYLMQNQTDKCFEYLDKALAHTNIYEHVSVKDYEKDNRWDVLCNNPDTSIQNAYLSLLKKWKKQETLK